MMGNAGTFLRKRLTGMFNSGVTEDLIEFTKVLRSQKLYSEIVSDNAASNHVDGRL